MLDSVRAARSMGLNIGDKTVTVGYSQGGHSALWTGQFAPTYAPDVEILGAVSLSGPTDMVALAEARFNDENAFDTAAEVIASWADYYTDMDLTSLVTAQGEQVVEISRDECAGGKIQQAQGPLTEFLSSPLLDDPTWQQLLQENSTGAEPSEGQIFMAQALRDQLVPAEVAQQALPTMCSVNDNLRYEEYPVTHGGLRVAAGPDMLQFVADRFAGKTSDVGQDCNDVS